jgi:hypothetical protein
MIRTEMKSIAASFVLCRRNFNGALCVAEASDSLLSGLWSIVLAEAHSKPSCSALARFGHRLVPRLYCVHDLQGRRLQRAGMKERLSRMKDSTLSSSISASWPRPPVTTRTSRGRHSAMEMCVVSNRRSLDTDQTDVGFWESREDLERASGVNLMHLAIDQDADV